jgi:hypothetical protein
MWSGVRDRWASNPTAPDPDRWMPEEPVEVDRAEPTDGRHAFDRDAALTPIFTSLRRTSARRPRGRTGGGPLRAVPEPVDRFRDDPPTAPIPIVPALHAVDPYESGGYEPYPPVDPYRSRGYRAAPVDPYSPGSFAPRQVPVEPPPSRAEMTAVWPRIDDPAYYDPATYPPASYGPGYPVTAPGYPVTDTGRHHRHLAPAGW